MKTDDKYALLDKPKTIFTVVAYEDRSTRDRVIRASDQLVNRLQDELEFDFSWWRFDYFKDESLAELAANDAIQADVLVVAAHSAEFPAALRSWLESWAHRKQNLPSALVGMLGNANDAKAWSTNHTFLSSIAAKSGMDYLPRLSMSAFGSQAAAHDPFSAVQTRAETMTPVMEDILNFHPPYRRWGINE